MALKSLLITEVFIGWQFDVPHCDPAAAHRARITLGKVVRIPGPTKL
jgi:hypothetical protein